MIRQDYIVEQRESMRGGDGTVAVKSWVSGDQKPPNTRLAATLVFPPGASIGEHTHEGEAELFNVLSGSGEYIDDGQGHAIKQGDIMVCYSGHSHSIRNTGDVPLEIVAIIVTE